MHRRRFFKTSGLALGTGLAIERAHGFQLSGKQAFESAECDILIIGASFGGVAAALAAARMGKRVIITEETAWIGGQATTQGVPMDEHPWIENYGRTQSYADFRTGVRNYYRKHYPLSYAAQKDPYFNPGACWVSRIGFEPRVGIAVLDEMLAPHYTAGRVLILTEHKSISVEMDHDRCSSVTVRDLNSHEKRTIQAPYILDATELGDLLDLGKIEHVMGAEPQSDTEEPNAYGEGDTLRQQPFTHLISVDYLPGENHTIEKPKDYDKYRNRFQRLVGIADAGEN